MNISKHITISSITANIFILFAVFTTGNFVYQAFTSQDWTTALERSFSIYGILGRLDSYESVS